MGKGTVFGASVAPESVEISESNEIAHKTVLFIKVHPGKKRRKVVSSKLPYV